MNLKQWTLKHNRVTETAKRIIKMRQERIEKLCKLGGLGDYNGCTLHNCMIGKPWPSLDYKIIKLAHYLDRHLWDASRIVEKWEKKNPYPFE